MVRIYYEFPDDLHRKLTKAAAREGIAFKDYLIRVLEDVTQREAEASTAKSSVSGETLPPTR